MIKKPRWKSMTLLLIVFFTLSAIFATLFFLESQGFISIPDQLVDAVQVILQVSLILFFTSLIARLTVNRVFNLVRSLAGVEQSIFLSKVYAGVIYTIGLLSIFYVAGMTLGNITLLAGLLTTGLAFALREILLSYFIWIILLRKTPFRIDDHIKIGDDVGRVKRIGTFFVTIEDYKKNIIKIPNRNFIEKSLLNYAKKGVPEVIKVPLASLPRDAVDRSSKLENRLVKAGLTDVVVQFVTESGVIHLVVEYLTAPAQKVENRRLALTHIQSVVVGLQKKNR